MKPFNISGKIKNLLEAKDMSNLELSKISGVPNSTLADILNGKTNRISINTVIGIADALDVDTEYLINDEINDPHYIRNQKAAALVSLDRDHLSEYKKLSDPGKEKATAYVIDIQPQHPRTDNIVPLYPAEAEEAEEELIPVKYTNDTPAAAGVSSIVGDIEFETVYLPDNEIPRGFDPDADYIVMVRGESMEPELSDKDYVFLSERNQVYPGNIGVFCTDDGIVVKEQGEGVLLSLNPAFDNIDEKMHSDIRCIGKYLGKVDEKYLKGK